MRKILIIVLSMFVVLIGCADRDVEKNEYNLRYKLVETGVEELVKEELLIEDFEALYNYVKEYYKAPKLINDQKAFDLAFSDFKSRIESDMSIHDFEMLCTAFLNTLNSGDVYIDHKDNSKELYLPFSISVNDGWFIDTCYMMDDSYAGYEILQINGTGVGDLEKSLFEVAAVTYQNPDVKMLEDYYTFARSFNCVYGSFETIVVTIKSDDLVTEITLDPFDNDTFNLICRDEVYYKEQMTYERLDDKSLLLHMGTLGGADFKSNVDWAFDMIEEEGITSLVVDFRGLKEGSIESATYLLSYLTEETWIKGQEMAVKPASFFEGHIYVLTDYDTSGVAVLFSEYIQDSRRGLIVGEIPSSYNYYFEKTIAKVLPHTKMHVHIGKSPIMIESADSIKELVPNWEVDPSDTEGIVTFLKKL